MIGIAYGVVTFIALALILAAIIAATSKRAAPPSPAPQNPASGTPPPANQPGAAAPVAATKGVWERLGFSIGLLVIVTVIFGIAWLIVRHEEKTLTARYDGSEKTIAMSKQHTQTVKLLPGPSGAWQKAESIDWSKVQSMFVVPDVDKYNVHCNAITNKEADDRRYVIREPDGKTTTVTPENDQNVRIRAKVGEMVKVAPLGNSPLELVVQWEDE